MSGEDAVKDAFKRPRTMPTETAPREVEAPCAGGGGNGGNANGVGQTRPTLDPPRRIDQALGAEHEYNMRELFDAWDLPRRFREGVAGSWRCRLVPMAADEAQQRAFLLQGVPFLVTPDHARDVFDAVKKPSEMTTGDDDGEGAKEEEAVDAVSWACESPWSVFPRPKVAMVGGWGAPGSHLLSERHMRMVRSFREVVDGSEPLNLQMFHRDDTSVPNLSSRFRWPLPAFFSADPPDDASSASPASPGAGVASGGRDATAAASPVPEGVARTEPRSGPSEALPAAGAIHKTGGVGVPLDAATRLSAAQALTWWHLDDCGEFVFQVGLPLDVDKPPRARLEDGAPRPPQPVLLGPTGKPVVKLFVFAEKEDYEWVAQDGVMNQTMKQSALDLFDTPDHFLPQGREMTPPFSAAPLAGDDAVYHPPDEEAGPMARRPTFWVAPLEAGGCPLLSPPNLIHLVLTVRDCVMVEERRLSLMFLDEVHYFQRRADRWCEPPVQYRFLREDLVDPARCRNGAVAPLLRVLRGGVAPTRADCADDPEAETDGNCADTVGARAAAWSRAKSSLEVLVSDPGRYALDGETRREVEAALSEADAWLNGARGGGVARDAAAACIASDPRRARTARLLAAMPGEGEKNVHRLGYFSPSNESAPESAPVRGDGEVSGGGGSGDRGAPYSAVVHEKGRPRWGPVRGTREEALADRKEMRRAVKENALDAVLRRWRSKVLGD